MNIRSALLIPTVFLACACSLFAKKPATTPSAAPEAAPHANLRVPKPDSESILNPRGIDFGRAPEKIAFGSGADQDQPEPIWKAILNTDPDLFLSVGDIISANEPSHADIGAQYRKLNKIPEYREARQKIPFMAIWNDGEFGTSDGGADAPTKAVARKEFLSYFRYVKDSIPLARDGLYHSKMIGGQITGKRHKRAQGPTLQVIMLDTRSFRSPLNKVDDPANPNHRYDPVTDKNATLLGEEQWSWLEDQLKKPADLRIVVTPIQLIATQHGFEKWANIPAEREKFFSLLRKTRVKNLIVVSGDRRLGSIAKTNVRDWGPLYEVTSSALNAPSAQDENDKDYLAAAYTKENFGLATVDWQKKKIRLELKDVEGRTIQTADVKLK